MFLLLFSARPFPEPQSYRAADKKRQISRKDAKVAKGSNRNGRIRSSRFFFNRRKAFLFLVPFFASLRLNWAIASDIVLSYLE